MKQICVIALLCTLFAGCSTSKPHLPQTPKTTFSSFDQPVAGEVEKRHGAKEINFRGVSLQDFLVVYQEVSGRTVLSSAALPSPSISLLNQSPVTRTEVLQLFDTVLAQNNIAMVLSGEKAVKVVPVAAAGQEAGPVINLPADQLPDSGSFMVRIVHLKTSKPSEIVSVVQPFAKVPNGIIPMDKERILVLRDFSANIKQMLKLVDIAEGSGGH